MMYHLCGSFAAIGERAALIVPDGDDAGDVVLESLRQLSVRYHPLAGTSPSILSDMRVLCGALDRAAIAAAGLANSWEERPLDELLPGAVRYALEACVYLQRGQLWQVVEVLHP